MHNSILQSIMWDTALYLLFFYFNSNHYTIVFTVICQYYFLIFYSTGYWY